MKEGCKSKIKQKRERGRREECPHKKENKIKRIKEEFRNNKKK